LEYIPIRGGTYRKYEAQQHRITQAINKKKEVEKTLRISDTEKKLDIGALFRLDGTTPKLIGRVYDGRQYPTTPPDAAFRKTFSHNVADAVWNQNNRPFRVFEFEAKGLNAAGRFPDIVCKYEIAVSSAHSNAKTFMLLSYEQDVLKCSWSGVMAEVFDNTIAKDYSSAHSFKLITEI
jgi:hypothetical protein